MLKISLAACALIAAAPAPPVQTVGDALQATERLKPVTDADRAWLMSYNGRDPAIFDRVWAPDAVLVTTFGKVKTREEERRDTFFSTPPPPEVTENRFAVSEQQAREYGDAVVVIGRFTNTGRYKGEPFERAWRYTNVYVKADGSWQLVTSQFAPIADPKSPKG